MAVTDAAWRKSTHSGTNGGDCVELTLITVTTYGR